MSERARLVSLSVWVVILAGVSFAVPAAHLVSWSLLGLSCAVAMVIGIVHNRPRHALPWLLLAASVACLAAGDFTAELLLLLQPDVDPFPSLADVFYICQYALIAAGFVGLYRLGVVRRDAAGVLDALTLTAGAALLSWVYLIGPYVANPDLTIVQKLISAAYPLGDLLLLGTGASLLTSMRPTPALRLLAAGGIGLLGADVAYGIIQLNGTWQVGTPVDLGWVIFYLCWALAAMHPSMRELTEPKLLRERKEGERPGRLVLLGLASLIAPAVLAVQVLTTGVSDGMAIAILSAALSTLVLIRLARAASAQARSVVRERALRRAGAQLLSATDRTEVHQIVSHAVRRLLPPGRTHQVLLDLPEAGDDRPDSPARTDATAKAAAAGAGPMIVYTDGLPQPIREALPGFEVTLRCDLPAQPGRAPGTLYIAGDETVLATLQESAQVLAGQAGLTLQRIALGAEVDRRNSESYFRTLVLNTADVILILDSADRIRYASPSASELFESPEVTGMALPDLVVLASRNEVIRRLARTRELSQDEGGSVWRVPRPVSGEALVEANCRDLTGEPTVDGVVVTLRDVTQSLRMRDELYRQATVDALTGLPNRTVFVDAAQQAVERAQGNGARAGVVLAGLDDFKLVNNTMGHHAGDELLAMVGARLSEAMRTLDVVMPINGTQWTVSRLGSDEFASCLHNVRDQETVDRVGAAVMDALKEPFTLSRGAVTVRASIGVAMTGGETHAAELMRQVDLALSVAKDAGKGRMMQYEDSLHTLMADRLQMRGDLEKALAEGSFALKFQPIVDLALAPRPQDGATDRRTAGFEALVRWHHPERGDLRPDTFIELAEESGLIVPLGNWVLHHAIRMAAGWRTDGGGEPYVSVNVSAQQLRAADFVGRVLDELAESGLPAQRLVLEITESLLAQGTEVHEELALLREHGVRVAIDDFGTGFSSLSYLRQLPIDVLKLDKSFVDTVTSSPDQHAIVATVIQLANTLHLDVVAEGIETEEELSALTTMGCSFGQGFLVSRPMDHDDAVHWLYEETATPVTQGRSAG